MDAERVAGLLLEALETERAGIAVYEAAIRCAADPGLHDEWLRCRAETAQHGRVLGEVLEAFDIDADADTPGRELVRAKGKALVAMIEVARERGDPVSAQIVAAECIVDAETKDSANWQIVGEIAKCAEDPALRGALTVAYARVEDEQEDHLARAQDWTRALWLQSLALGSSRARAGAAQATSPAKTRKVKARKVTAK